MPRLIDADALLSDFDKRAALCKHFAGTQIFFLEAKKVVNLAPTIDAEPVRHGRWIEKPTTVKYFCHSECSVCGSWQGERWMNFCPNCGAKMDAKDNDVPTNSEAHRPEDCVNYATRMRDGRAVCLGTRELDPCDGAGCKRWKAKGEKK